MNTYYSNSTINKKLCFEVSIHYLFMSIITIVFVICLSGVCMIGMCLRETEGVREREREGAQERESHGPKCRQGQLCRVCYVLPQLQGLSMLSSGH